jgi:hypothetical protein
MVWAEKLRAAHAAPEFKDLAATGRPQDFQACGCSRRPFSEIE